MIRQGAERPGDVLRKAIDFQLEAIEAPKPPLSIKEVRRDRRVRGAVLVGAGRVVRDLGFERGDERLQRVGASVADRGWRAIDASSGTP